MLITISGRIDAVRTPPVELDLTRLEAEIEIFKNLMTLYGMAVKRHSQ
jgi:hypothetical protein